jgi:hypothetical protein
VVKRLYFKDAQVMAEMFDSLFLSKRASYKSLSKAGVSCFSKKEIFLGGKDE